MDQIGIRPEFLTLGEGEGLTCSIEAVEDLGRHRIVRTSVAGESVTVLVPAGKSLPSANAALQFDAAHTLFYRDGYLMEGAA